MILLEAKNLLARLLATENIYIRHKKVKTASFDTVKRILTFPIWKEMSDELYTMLAGHEVGHALYTLRKRLDEIAKEIDPDNVSIAAAYVNIIEDARIERLIKAMYPGLRRVFGKAYAELFDKNLFGTRHAEVDHRSFIDRANLYFKVGEHINPTFTEAERNMLRMIEGTQTFDDVLRVTKEIYEWAKNNNQHPDPIELPEEIIEQLKEALKNAKCSDDEDDEEDNSPSLNPTIKIKIQKPSDEDGDEDEDGEAGDEEDSGGSEDDEESGDGNEKDDESEAECESEGDADSKSKSKTGKKKTGKGTSKGKGKGDEPKDGDSDGDGDSGDDEKPAKSKKKDKSDGKGEGEGEDDEPDADQKTKSGNKQGQKASASKNNNKKLKPVDPGPPPAPITQQNFDENVVKLNDEDSGDIIYVTLPKPILKNILVDYKEVHENLRLYFGGKRFGDANSLKTAEEEFLEFKRTNQDKINYIFTQFEMKKQAEQYKRIRVHKTGSIDTLRLHAYKYEDDLFRSVASILDAKNHGLLFVIDWSTSMQSSMAGTIEQLISLTAFCRKAQIPFEVYSLTTGTRNAFDSKPGDLVYSYNFRMRNYLSSRMNQQEYYQACVNLFALMPNGDFSGGPVADNLIGCTPLDEAIVTAIDLIEDLRNRTKAKVVNAVFLTDGGANTVSQYMNENGTKKYMNGGDRFVIEDRLTRKHYEFSGEYGQMTPTMLRILRDRQNINAVGFYVTSSFDYMFFNDDDSQTKKHKKDFDEHGYAICTDWGFNELYILKGGENLRVKTPTMKVTAQPGSPHFIQEATNKFTQHGTSTMKQRLMVDRFVKMIA